MNKNELTNLISSLVVINDNDMRIRDIFKLYITRSSSETRTATVEHYKCHSKMALRFFDSIGVEMLSEIDISVMHQYIAYEKGRGLKNNTINHRLGFMKQSMKYAKEYGYIMNDPLEKLHKLKKDDVETKIITWDVIERILEHFENQEPTAYNLRCRMIVNLALSTGVRLNELRNIKMKNVDLEKNIILLTYTKNGKNRPLFLTSDVSQMIRDYVDVVDPKEYLVVSQYGTQMKRQAMYKFLDITKKKLNLPDEVSISFHKFRHSFATYTLKNGANLREVQKMLGHLHINQTIRYTHLTEKDLEHAHAKFNPLAAIHA